MASTNNKIRRIANNASNTNYTQRGNIGLAMSSDDWIADSNGKRENGELPGSGASSMRYNTSFKQLSYIGYIVSEGFAKKSTTSDIDPDLNNEDTLATNFSNLLINTSDDIINKLSTGSIKTAKIGDSQITTVKIADKNVTKAKLGDLITIGTSTKNGITVNLTQGEGNGFTIGISGDSVTKADKFTTARTITISDNATVPNTGVAQSFDGSANITVKLPTTISATTFSGELSGNSSSSTKLKTSRLFSITSSDGTGSGVTTSFNGEGNAVIKLPSTIKASLTGNASTASYASSDTSKGTIEQRLTNLGFKSGSVALSGGTASVNSVTRQGNYIIVNVNVDNNTNNNIKNGSSLFTIPENFRPKNSYTTNCGVYCLTSGGYASYYCTITINTDGSVIVNNISQSIVRVVGYIINLGFESNPL